MIYVIFFFLAYYFVFRLLQHPPPRVFICGFVPQASDVLRLMLEKLSHTKVDIYLYFIAGVLICFMEIFASEVMEG